MHVVVTEPGAVRGNHWHRRGSEILTVIGPALIRVKEEGVTRDVTVTDGQVMQCRFPPGVAHAICHTGDRPGVLIAFNTEVHDPANPDVVREELL